MSDAATLISIAAIGVAVVVLLITVVRLPAFLALAAGAFGVGLAARVPLGDITRSFQGGVGDTLGFVAMVIGLGTVIGKLLAESGGSAVVSSALIRAMGERRLDWAMMLSGFVIGLPVFFQVGLVLLAPVLFTVVQQTGAPLLGLGLPLVAGLSNWGWEDNGWGNGVLGPQIFFAASGPQRIRIQPREDGLSIDQIVLSPARYLTTAPGPTKNDTTILNR